jgi:hypothetical protein
MEAEPPSPGSLLQEIKVNKPRIVRSENRNMIFLGEYYAKVNSILAIP